MAKMRHSPNGLFRVVTLTAVLCALFAVRFVSAVQSERGVGQIRMGFDAIKERANQKVKKFGQDVSNGVLEAKDKTTEAISSGVDTAKEKLQDGKEYAFGVKEDIKKYGEIKGEAIAAAFNNKLSAVHEKLFELLGKHADSCPNIFSTKSKCFHEALKEKEYQSHADKAPLKNRPVSERLHVRFWTEAARMAKLARVVYNDFEEIKRADVQIIKTLEKKWVGAEAFISVRNSGFIPPFSEEDASLWTNLNTAQKFRNILDRDIWSDSLPTSNYFGSFAVQMELRYQRWVEYQHLEEQKYSAESGEAPAVMEVVVRGTSGALDAVVDVYALQKELKVKVKKTGEEKYLGKVHRGFYSQYEALREGVRETVGKHIDSITRGTTLLYFTGHSLGGAVAQLLALDVATHFDLPPRVVFGMGHGIPEPCALVYTFGSPRVGDKTFAAHMRSSTRHLRYKFMGDIVSEIPLNNMAGMEYEHGDTYGIGLAVLPKSEMEYQRKGVLPYVSYCLPECSPLTLVLRQLTSFHASDWAYQKTIEALWITQRDSGGSAQINLAFEDDDTSGRLDTLRMMIGDEVYGRELMVALRCMGVDECQDFLMFQGKSSVFKRDRCRSDNEKNNLYFDNQKFNNMRREGKIEEALEYRRQYFIPFFQCMEDLTSSDDFFDVLKPVDWINCYGNVHCIESRRAHIIKCFDKPECVREL